MDIGELLFLLFLLLPLLGQLFSRTKGPELPPTPVEDEVEYEMAEEDGYERPLRLEPEGGWGDWAVGDEAAVVEGFADEAAPPLTPEAERVTVPVVSMEPLLVDRPAEHARLHRRIDQEPALRPAHRRATRLGGSIAGREEIRRAIILGEVLGPPKSLS